MSWGQYTHAGTAQQLSQSVARALVKKADAAFLTQPAPTPPANGPSTGLLNISGVVDGGAVTTDLDALITLVATLQANGGNFTHIVLDPYGWSQLRQLKTETDSNASLLGAGTTDATPMLLSLPVIVNNQMPPDTGLVIDRSAVVSAVGPVRVSVSEDFYFSTDDIALKATWRTGQNIVRPNRVGKFTTAAGS